MNGPGVAWRARVKALALGSTALSLLLLSSTAAAMAQTAAPNSLPGPFRTNQAGTTYAVSGGNAGTITLSGAAQNSVLEWGTSGLGTEVAPSGTMAAPNAGFSIGAGAGLTLAGGAGATLVNDASGGASVILGSLTATGLEGPLYIANPSGVLVGAGGTIAAPREGVGLLGFAQISIDGAFGASGTIESSKGGGTGAVSVDPAASISGGPLLIAGNGTVNVGAVAREGDTYVLDGATFTATAQSVAPSTTALGSSGGATVNFTGGTPGAALVVEELAAGGAVTNSGTLDLGALTWGAASVGRSQILGTFTNAENAYASVNALVAGSIVNAGTLTETGGTLTAIGRPGAASGADITNSGVLDERTTVLEVRAGTPGGVSGNFANTGTIDFSNGVARDPGNGAFIVDAANIFLGGSIRQGGRALDEANILGAFVLNGGYAPDPFFAAPNQTPSGVVDIASSVYTGTASTLLLASGGRTRASIVSSQIVGQAIRVLTGGVSAVGVPLRPSLLPLAIYPGAGTPTDPFVRNGRLPDGTASQASLAYNLSLFPGAVLASTTGAGNFGGQAGPDIYISGLQASATSPGSNVNLNGVVSTAASGTANQPGGNIRVHANTINGNAGGDAGFALESGGTLSLDVSGNVNNPVGAGPNGSAGFQYNYLPVSVAPTTDNSGNPIAGTATILISGGPSASGSVTPKGSLAQFLNLLVDGNASFRSNLAAPTPVSPQTMYADNHLVLQATGDISAAGYWPGLLYLATVVSPASPTSFSANGAISLAGKLDNALPADLTTRDVMGSTGRGGVFFMTNHLNLDGNTVTISGDSWVNFVNTETATAFRDASGQSFFGGTLPSAAGIALQQLPASDFQPTGANALAAFLLKFIDQSTSYPASNVYAMFGGTKTLDGSYDNNGQRASLVLGQSYSFAQLAGGAELSNFPNGRIYVSLGARLTSGSAGNDYAPNMSNPSLPDYTTRWGYAEISYVDPSTAGHNGADLTAADQLGVPLELSATGPGASSNVLTWHASTANVMQSLGKLANFGLADPTGTSPPFFTSNAIIVNPGGSGVAVPGVSAPVARIISPSTVPPTGADGSTVYPSMQPYLTMIQNSDAAGNYTRIEGSHTPSPGVADTYIFKAYIQSNQPMPNGVSAGSIQPGDLVLTGSITGTGAPNGTPTTAVIRKASLTDSNIYGAPNGLFTMLQGSDLNGSVTHAAADYLSALNFGLIDSPEMVSGYPAPLGNLPSYDWYGNAPQGLIKKLPITDAFAPAQPSCRTCYNAYAAYLATVTDAYGFPYNDRLQTPLVTFAGGDTLTLTLLPDGGPTSLSLP